MLLKHGFHAVEPCLIFSRIALIFQITDR